MTYQIDRLNEENRALINGFTCVETDDMLKGYSSKERRRIRKHSLDMDTFLRNEAFDDQEKGLNTTFLFISDEKIIAYLSLCTDAIKLEFDERDGMGMSYSTVPALKIARLAVSVNYQGKGLGTEGIEFTVYVSQLIREYSGIAFITLDCYRHRVSYYERFGFVRNLIQPFELPYDSPISMRLWIEKYLENVESINDGR